MHTITPFLWFDGQAEEAMTFYLSIFPNSKVLGVVPGPDGKAMSVSFEIEGQRFHALNGGPQFTFTPAISLFVSCETQAEVDGLPPFSRGASSEALYLDERIGRQLLHVTFGSVLTQGVDSKGRGFKESIVEALQKSPDLHLEFLESHFDRHLSGLSKG